MSYSAFGAVFKISQQGGHCPLAVKHVTVPDDADPASLEEIEKEIDVLKQCNHVNVVSYHGLFRRTASILWVPTGLSACSSHPHRLSWTFVSLDLPLTLWREREKSLSPCMRAGL